MKIETRIAVLLIFWIVVNILCFTQYGPTYKVKAGEKFSPKYSQVEIHTEKGIVTEERK